MKVNLVNYAMLTYFFIEVNVHINMILPHKA